MPLKFDATLKDVVAQYAADYKAALGLTDLPPARLLNVDLSTVSAATDLALGHGDPLQAITDLNFQSGPDADVTRRALFYNTVFHYRYNVPVHSIVILLRPAADSPKVSDRVSYVGRKRRGKLNFNLEVIRLWEQPAARYLQAGLGVLPLATLCRLPGRVSATEGLRRVVRQIDERVHNEARPEAARLLMTAAYLLTGLRIEEEAAQGIFRGLSMLRESSTYQLILKEGALEELQRMILQLGRIRFGPASEETQTRLQGITDLDRLRRIHEAILAAGSWEELLETE
jgi:predicted transposase YdaD